jgi:hypothetical protein
MLGLVSSVKEKPLAHARQTNAARRPPPARHRCSNRVLIESVKLQRHIPGFVSAAPKRLWRVGLCPERRYEDAVPVVATRAMASAAFQPTPYFSLGILNPGARLV